MKEARGCHTDLEVRKMTSIGEALLEDLIQTQIVFSYIKYPNKLKMGELETVGTLKIDFASPTRCIFKKW